ncbi:BlaI/MecI/CopY family transcriptional regulator [Cellvibrio sp. KY-GH-1]|uniref:BlaI/MecI/CopY family transcriptional regulator n=1 Tax=Cellvibrio sp. KY-GH-1 TaxID=2303332 RepID=UPI0012479695|nr:BlaI/MecI/CopY family transcriptional regulator [Cellvibrio sp. KY-GH-1]QEY16512.1 BlaI/MecI/CopY family transcriptional regulator [Cellvibrio sp. KY-GH-1]
MATPSQAELEILNLLWRHKEASVQLINDELNKLRPIGYTTTLKTMQLMAQKGWLDRRMEGKSHIYQALLQEDEIKENLLSRFIDSTFMGSRSQLLMRLLGQEKVSKDEIRELKEYLKKLEE